MNYTLPIVWSLLLVGVPLAVVLGRKSSGWGISLLISVGIAILLFVLENIALPACVSAKLCPSLGDTGIIYTLYPFAAIPVFWLAAGWSARREL